MRERLVRLDLFALPIWAGVFLIFQFIPGVFASSTQALSGDLYLKIVVLGLACFFALAFIGTRWRKDSSPHEPATFAWQCSSASKFGLTIVAAGFLVKLRHCASADSLTSICSFEDPMLWAPNVLHRLGFFTMATSFLLRHSSFAVKVGQLVALVSIYMAWSLVAGAGRFELAAALVGFGAIMWYVGGLRMRMPLFGLVLLTMPVFFVKTWLKYSTHLAASDFAAMSYSSFLYEGLFARLSQHTIVTAILSQWDLGPMGLYGWEDFVNALLGRSLTQLDGNDLGKAFGVLYSGDAVTGVGPTFLGDFYLMGGALGVAIGMSLLGFAYGWLSTRVRTLGGPGAVLIYAALLPTIVHGLEDWFFLTLARSLQVAALSAMVVWGVNWFGRHYKHNLEVKNLKVGA